MNNNKIFLIKYYDYCKSLASEFTYLIINFFFALSSNYSFLF